MDSTKDLYELMPEGWKPEEQIPEYVKCIGLEEKNVKSWNTHYTIGKIYKLMGISEKGNYEVLSSNNMPYYCDKSQFIPATKEEYDMQNMKPEEKEWIPKVGDWVKCIENLNVGDMGYQSGL